jgi:hypothetical protein
MSHIDLNLQLGSDLKLRTRLGPQYPHPTTPTPIGSFIVFSKIVPRLFYQWKLIPQPLETLAPPQIWSMPD